MEENKVKTEATGKITGDNYDLTEHWKKCIRVYNEMKRIYISSEEIAQDFSVTVQPIKEQRDALDHIVRVYESVINNKESENLEGYIDKNFSKALGHLYRAYYDSADIFSIILRERISAYLSKFSYSQLAKVWRGYKNERKNLFDINKKIVELRLKKGTNKKEEQEEIFKEYSDIIRYLSGLNEYIFKDLYPQLCEEYETFSP